MIEVINIISDCVGLNTVLDPFQPVESAESTQRFLTKAVNVKLTDSKKIERCDTTEQVLTLTNGHSIFCDQSDCLVHDGGSMFGGSTLDELITSIETPAPKRTGMSGQRVGHTRYGKAIYFGNRHERGVYTAEGVCEAWVVDAYKGAVTTRPFAAYAPIFDHLAAFNGMILFSYDNHLFATEPGKPGLWEKTAVWSTDTRITMIKPVITDTFPVTGGVFVSDEKRISYLGGFLDDGTRMFAEPRTTNYPALEWCVDHGYADGSEFGEKSGLCAVFGTTQGLCIGYPDGQLVNVTQKNIKIPSGLSTGAILIDGHNIIITMR